MEILKANKLENIIMGLNFKDPNVDNYEDSELRKALLYVNVLYHIEKGDLKSVDNTIKKEDLFYSQYYWFNKFKNRYIELYGPNAGMEQQLFKMVEHYYEYTNGKVDWEIIEKIENGAI